VTFAVAMQVMPQRISAKAADATPPPNNSIRYEGKIYEFTSVEKITPQGVVVKHSNGRLVIPFEKVPPSIAKPYKKQIEEALERREAPAKFEGKQAQETLDRRDAIVGRILDERSAREAMDRRDNAAKLGEKQTQEALEYREKQLKYPGYEVFQAAVVQVLEDGLLVDKMEAYGSRFVRSGTHIFLQSRIEGAYDGASYWVGAYPNGVYAYQSVLGARTTLRRWVLVRVEGNAKE